MLPTDNLLIEKDVVYGHGDGTELHLDLARPRSRGEGSDRPLPAMIFIHGGGWSNGNRQLGETAILLLANQGYFAVTITYRLAPLARFPAQLEDCKTAVRWIRANAEKYGIDPTRIGAAGHSAGGHLSALLALTPGMPEFEGTGGHAKYSTAIQAVSPWSAPSDFLWTGWPATRQGFLTSLLDVSPDEFHVAARRASPITYVNEKAPPFLLVHGGTDSLVPADQSRLLLAALESKNVPARLKVYPDEGHIFTPLHMLDALQQAMTFFDRCLKPTPDREHVGR
jgi:acetyl esterase/lipase